jgi:hypothetical protein
MGKIIIGIGLVFILLGVVTMLASRMGIPLGRLPGDFTYKGKNGPVYFPLGTSILLSILLSFIFYLISRFRL